MIFSETQIEHLRKRVNTILSPKRFTHTLGVLDAAIKIASYCLPTVLDEIGVAALLHDISKEYSEAEQLDAMKKGAVQVTASDLSTPAMWHSITAPSVIIRDFSEFATKNVLSSAYNHTVGSPDMSLFDEIIFVADYIEDGRKYPSCVAVRENLYRDLELASSSDECVRHLHKAAVAALDNTILNLINSGKYVHEKTVSTRNAFLNRYSASFDLP